jgi:hypothetical protein
MATPAMFSWQQPLAALFGGISAAGQPGGFANFGAGVNQTMQQQQQAAQAQQMAELRDLEIQQQQQQMARANTEAAQKDVLRNQIAAMLGGAGSVQTASGVRPVGNYGAATGGAPTAPGQPAMFQNWSPEQRATFQQYAQSNPEGALQFIVEQQFAQPKDNSTDDMREYQQAVSQGFQGTLLDYQMALKKAGAAAGSSTTIYNKDYGTIPPGHRLVEGADGVRLEALPVEALPGSPAAAEAAAAEAKVAEQQATQAQSADIVTQDIDRIIEKIEVSPNKTTGFIGNILKGIGGTEASNVKSLLGTVEANTAFDRLQQMRDQSPTGGALGSITERELSLLAATKGSLEQSQDDKQIVYNLKRLKNVVLDIVHGPGKGPQRYSLDDAGGGNDLKSKYGLE